MAEIHSLKITFEGKLKPGDPPCPYPLKDKGFSKCGRRRGPPPRKSSRRP